MAWIHFSECLGVICLVRNGALALFPPNHPGLDGLKSKNVCCPHPFFLPTHLLPFLILPLSSSLSLQHKELGNKVCLVEPGDWILCRVGLRSSPGSSLCVWRRRGLGQETRFWSAPGKTLLMVPSLRPQALQQEPAEL